jgi:transposase
MDKDKKQQRQSRFSFDPQTLNSLDKETLVSLLMQMHEQYQHLSESVQVLMREKYGPKTDRFSQNPDQLNVFQKEKVGSEQDTAQNGLASNQSQSSDSKSTKKSKAPRNQNPRPSNLQRVPIRGAQPSAETLLCHCCSLPRQLINEVVRRSRLAYKPATIHQEDFIACIYTCTGCGDTFTIEPNVPAAALKLGADPGLVSNIAVDRFADSLPLKRQEERFARHGVPIARSTMCGWLAITAKMLRRIYERMKAILLESKIIETDDSPMKVQDRSKERNIKIGRVWIYRGDEEHPVNLFDYTSGRGRAGPIDFLQGFQGYLLGDCYSGNQALCAETGCIHVACHAHARRYFIKAEPNNKSACAEMLSMYSDLFEIERVASELGIKGEERKLMRVQEARPILDSMKHWLDRHSLIALPKSSFGKAIYYCLNNWTELTNYLLDGDLRIDNNLAEQEMKRVAINRKNSLFFGSDNGGENAEVFMSLISTCRRHNVEPWSYLKDVIQKLAEDPDRDIDPLLPQNWKAPPADPEIPAFSPPPELVVA